MFTNERLEQVLNVQQLCRLFYLPPPHPLFWVFLLFTFWHGKFPTVIALLLYLFCDAVRGVERGGGGGEEPAGFKCKLNVTVGYMAPV